MEEGLVDHKEKKSRNQGVIRKKCYLVVFFLTLT